MRASFQIRVFASLLTFCLIAALPALAQSASESFHAAGESLENAGSSTGHAVENAYQGTKTATKDTDITTKVKLALHDDSLTKGQDIHVKTVDGVVTLRGHVASSLVSARAEKVAADTTGVRSVHNRLHAPTSATE
jgi:hyperosmotically inducible periplasmic protein